MMIYLKIFPFSLDHNNKSSSSAGMFRVFEKFRKICSISR